MLIAELRRKTKSVVRCNECGSELTSMDAHAHYEDALTSHVLGILRHLPSAVGTIPLLRSWRIDLLGDDDDLDVVFWPSGFVDMVPINAGDVHRIGLEPDVVIDGPSSIVCIEAKLGMKLGTDPLQLPKEVAWIVSQARDRDWRLVCLTADAAEPQIPSFDVDNGAIVTASAAPVAVAVASYFTAAAKVFPTRSWPAPTLVEQRVRWTSWSEVAGVLAHSRDREETPAHARRALGDICELLHQRGLVRQGFNAFRRIESVSFERFGTCWSAQRTHGFGGFRRLGSAPDGAIKGWFATNARLWTTLLANESGHDTVARRATSAVWFERKRRLWETLRPSDLAELPQLWLRRAQVRATSS